MFCRAPFDCLDVCHLHASPCCRLWLAEECHVNWSSLPDPWAIWNCEPFQVLRRSILDGSFRFCRGCPRWIDRDLRDTPDDSCQPVMQRGPFVVNFGTDSVCNLRCWTCYLHPGEPYTDPADRALREAELRSFAAAFFPTSAISTFQTAGDPLASPMYRRFLQELDLEGRVQPTIRLFTNRQLLTTYWPTLQKIHRNIRSLWISIDAATRETYERVRCGASWDHLIESLQFARHQRLHGAVTDLQFNFVVRATNWREMPNFVDLGRRFAADRVDFGLFRRMWHPDAVFHAENIAAPSHPDHQAYCETITDPIFAPPFVQGAFRTSFCPVAAVG